MLFVIDEPPPALPLSQFPAIAFSPLVSDAATSRSAPGLPASLKGKGSRESEEMPNFQIQRNVREHRAVTVRSTAAKKQDETQKCMVKKMR